MRTNYLATCCILLSMAIAIGIRIDRVYAQSDYEIIFTDPGIRCDAGPEDHGCYGHPNPCGTGDAAGIFWSVNPRETLRRAVALLRSGREDAAHNFFAAAMHGYGVQGRVEAFRTVEAAFIDIYCPDWGEPMSLNYLRETWADMRAGR